MPPLLEIIDLTLTIRENGRNVNPVESCSAYVRSGEVIGLVGESGSGKTLTGLSPMRLLPDGVSVAGGTIRFDQRDILKMSDQELREIRGGEIGMVFQEPMTALNPLMTVGSQITETIQAHNEIGAQKARSKALELLQSVGIPDPEARYGSYPHQLSGGMRQRILIAIAISSDPRLLIADEPTTALDVTVQAQILDLLRQLQRKHRMSILLITHDLGVVTDIADRILVMYAGRIVEEGPTEEILNGPKHPYTVGLLHSIPSWRDERDRLSGIPGAIPNPGDLPGGCKFHPRCYMNDHDRCPVTEPQLEGEGGHRSRCHFPEKARESFQRESSNT